MWNIKASLVIYYIYIAKLLFHQSPITTRHSDGAITFGSCQQHRDYTADQVYSHCAASPAAVNSDYTIIV